MRTPSGNFVETTAKAGGPDVEALKIYFEWLQWIPQHPILTTIILTAEFTAMMKIYHYVSTRHGDTLGGLLKAVFAILFQPQNFVANATVVSLIGLEFPREKTTTSRLKRWKQPVQVVHGRAVPGELRVLLSEIWGDLKNGKFKKSPYLDLRMLWQFTFATKLCAILNKSDAGHC